MTIIFILQKKHSYFEFNCLVGHSFGFILYVFTKHIWNRETQSQFLLFSVQIPLTYSYIDTKTNAAKRRHSREGRITLIHAKVNRRKIVRAI